MKQKMKDTGICSDDIVRTFISRRVLPLKRRAHRMSEMYGPGDPTKITGLPLSKKDVVLKAKQICQTAMPFNWEWGFLPFSTTNPPTQEAKDRFPLIEAERRGVCRKRALDSFDPDPYIFWKDLKMGKTPASRLGRSPPKPTGSSNDLVMLEIHEHVPPLRAEAGSEFVDKLMAQGQKNKRPSSDDGSSQAPQRFRTEPLGEKKVGMRRYARKQMPTASGLTKGKRRLGASCCRPAAPGAAASKAASLSPRPGLLGLEKEQLIKQHQEELSAQKTSYQELKSQLIQLGLDHAKVLEAAEAEAAAKMNEALEEASNSTVVLQAELEELAKARKAAEEKVARLEEEHKECNQLILQTDALAHRLFPDSQTHAAKKVNARRTTQGQANLAVPWTPHDHLVALNARVSHMRAIDRNLSDIPDVASQLFRTLWPGEVVPDTFSRSAPIASRGAGRRIWAGRCSLPAPEQASHPLSRLLVPGLPAWMPPPECEAQAIWTRSYRQADRACTSRSARNAHLHSSPSWRPRLSCDEEEDEAEEEPLDDASVAALTGSSGAISALRFTCHAA
ncbi:hypothetical protein QYE76_059310 [Lolium multiflorum]|uniref:Uncharacterized protein n=1 Tax=Lolium multiflorum TaxID=4521 RepID=A0AAD8Q090_LOLMU|nr:hypothetical protein QYE76_059310 [Lolium multiflorum]